MENSPDFLTRPRRVPYETRIKQLVLLLNKKGSLNLDELVALWTLDPFYIKRLILMACKKYSYIQYDPINQILSIKKEAKKEGGKK